MTTSEAASFFVRTSAHAAVENRIIAIAGVNRRKIVRFMAWDFFTALPSAALKVIVAIRKFLPPLLCHPRS
jgi:hypothetical protein